MADKHQITETWLCKALARVDKETLTEELNEVRPSFEDTEEAKELEKALKLSYDTDDEQGAAEEYYSAEEAYADLDVPGVRKMWAWQRGEATGLTVRMSDGSEFEFLCQQTKV